MSELLAYDADGNVVATLGHVVARDDAGNVTGLVDFAAHEAAGGDHTDIWTVDSGDAAHPIKGSKVWPEHLGSQAYGFRVELTGDPGHKRIAALVARSRPAGTRDAAGKLRPATKGGHRRERAAIEAAIEAVPVVNGARDIRHIVGGPDRPLHLNEKGQTAKCPANAGTPKHLPLLGGRNTEVVAG